MKDKVGEDESVSETGKLKHLDYVQSIVTRMAHSSAQVKTWLLPVVTATYGYALNQCSGTVALLGIAAVLLFCYMDASYLRQERAYRRHYNAVVKGSKVPVLSLDPNDFDLRIPDADGDPSPKYGTDKKPRVLKRLRKAIRGWFFGEPEVWFSWSIFPFYGGFLAVGFAVLCYSVC